MIRRLTGLLVRHDRNAAAETAVVSCHGLGFLVHLPAKSSLPPVGAEVTLWTHLRVREDALDLFGFLREEELALFEMMQKIQRFPARTALAVIGRCGVEGFRQALLQNDLAALTAVPGVGRKLAQQMLLDMKGVINLAAAAPATIPDLDDAAQALVELGFKPAEAVARVEKAKQANPRLQDPAEIVKAALR